MGNFDAGVISGCSKWSLTNLTKEIILVLEDSLKRTSDAQKEDAEFVAYMDDVLDLYQQPFDPIRPLWCMDEKPYQLPKGTASVFLLIQPHTGRIVPIVEPTRTAVDWAEKLKYLVDVVEPDAEKIVLVQNNLNSHSVASLYKAFPPEEARRITQKLELHFTPKHGNWLNMAEIGINIMTNVKIPSIEALRKEFETYQEDTLDFVE